ncbi:MAG: AraC family transcriptional regulator [Eubacteriales bacterium]|nr:AraC family transcriptional regulator [Eubacteriales bacterium]
MFRETIGYKLSSRVKSVLECIVYYPAHMHTSAIEIICVLDGTVSISDSAMNHKLSAGDVYIFNAKDPHKIVTVSEKNIILTVQIDMEYYKKYQKRLDMTYFICDSYINKDQLAGELRYLRFLLAQIHSEYHSAKINESRLESLTKELLGFLTEQFQYYTYSKSKENSYDIVRRQEIKAEDPSYNRIYDIIDYIYESFRRKLRLEDIAKREFLSIYYLSRYIKKTCGLSFSELVTIARCEEAERLLGTTNKTMDEIALEVGFSNRKHFSASFKRWFHMTPSEYRRSVSRKSRGSISPQYDNYNEKLAQSVLESYLNEVSMYKKPNP